MITPTAPAKMNEKIFLVTEDLEASLEFWREVRLTKHLPLELPSAAFFERLRRQLKQTLTEIAFKGRDVRVDFVGPKRLPHLTKDAQELDKNSYWVTLDEVYVHGADFGIHSTRVYDYANGTEQLGYGVRPESNCPDIESQYVECELDFKEKKRLRSKNKVSLDLVVADDGLFTGETLLDACSRLESRLGTQVTEVRTAIATIGGLQKVLEALPYAKIYPGLVTTKIGLPTKMGLLDWICERDVYAGVPRSGHTLGEAGQVRSESPLAEYQVCRKPVIGKPYIFPFGEIERGASITEKHRETSAAFLNLSIILWQELERRNNCTFQLADIPRFMGPSTEMIASSPVCEHLIDIEQSIFGKSSGLDRWTTE